MVSRLLRFVARSFGLVVFLALVLLWPVSYFGTASLWTFRTAPGWGWRVNALTSEGGLRFWYRGSAAPADARPEWEFEPGFTRSRGFPLLYGRGALTWLGLSWESRRAGNWTTRAVTFPSWVIVVPLGLWHWTWIRGSGRGRHRRRQAAGHCPTCDYDLNHHPAHARCPECGTVRPAPPASPAETA